MPVPDFQTVMLPLLRLAEDGQEHSMSQAIEVLATQLNLTEEDLRERLPSGRQARFNNRVGWAATYLRKALLLENCGRGRFRLTDRGRQVLQKPPPRIDLAWLQRYPEVRAFRGESGDEASGELPGSAPAPSPPNVPVPILDPEEQLEEAYLTFRRRLASELLDQVLRGTPAFFERLVVQLLVAMGYGGSEREAGQAVGRTGDGGVDGVIKEDPLGLDLICIQAKRWAPGSSVGHPEIRDFAGAMDDRGTNKGVFITTSRFTEEAMAYVHRIGVKKKIVLIDGAKLAELLIDRDVGVVAAHTYVVKKIDSDFFLDAG
ncbi:MAG: restriction endonuclease [Polyangiaceae bacterium]|jgi:restriction system protein|nr:restriction endonuclease [Polyangiaceae bacterium]